MKNLTLIIPAKFEKESLPDVLSELSKYNLNIIIILEKTDDETIKSVEGFNCKIIFQSNKGYGDALILGIKNVETNYFCIFNADGSFDPAEIQGMINLLEADNTDLVFGSRYEKNSSSDDDTVVTLIGNYIFSFLGKILFKLPITDILYTFVLGKTDKVKKLELKSKDFAFCVELPIKSHKKG